MTDTPTGKPTQCAAHARSGRQCRQPAIPGGTVCHYHGGSAPQVRAAAARRIEADIAANVLADGLAQAYGEQVPDIDPAEAMLRAVSWKFAEVCALRAMVSQLSQNDRVWGTTREKTGGEDAGTTEEAKPSVWWQMLRTAEDQLIKFAAAARAAGCDERRVQIAEQQGDQLVVVIRTVIDRLDLTAEQLERVPDVVPATIRELTAAGFNPPM